jgi:hypothetical protein
VTLLEVSVPVGDVFASALRGDPCLLLDADGAVGQLPTEAWLRDADADDRAILGLCEGPTVDIGCGPGRMAQALGRTGRPALGIDVVPEAVRQSLGRGALALRRDVFERVPGEGRWGTALLADGNIGIGGDPVALLDRVRRLIAPSGRVVVEVAPPGAGIRTRQVRLESGAGRSRPFAWTVVGAEAVAAVAEAAGLRQVSANRFGDRHCAVLQVTA